MPLADRALVVGINRYPGLTTLSGPENDAQDFYDWVTDPAGDRVEKQNAVKILSSDYQAPDNPDGALPDETKIFPFFKTIDKCAQDNNATGVGMKAGKRLWLFFSGHGFAPSLDQSGVLMANATYRWLSNIPTWSWADLLHEGGWFDEVILFQDACRSRIRGGYLSAPNLPRQQAPLGQRRKRFYAFSAKDRQISKELPFNGTTRGVFSDTLLSGLRGHARDGNGAITPDSLKEYLRDNMRSNLTPADLADDDIAKEPEVYNPDLFDIVPADPTAISLFPVRITLPSPGLAARVLDSQLREVKAANPAPQIWSMQLPRNFYKLFVPGVPAKLFEVTGAVMSDGSLGLTDVSL